MLKIYRIKRTSASVLVNSNGKDIRIEFNGGSARNNGHGSFITSDPTTQKAIEKDRRFGTFDTGSIYLYEAIGSEDGNKAEAEAKAENVKQEPAKVITKANTEESEKLQMKFPEAKKHLIEKGISPDELKNFAQVKSQAGKLGIELIK
jgi:hypothetical protein